MPHPFWQDRRALVTLGPTRAYIDPVRYLANVSSGRLGTAIAEALLSAGAVVDVIAGEGAVHPRPAERLALHPIATVEELVRTVHRLAERPHPDVILHLMAVLDYQPAAPAKHKLPSGAGRLTLELAPTPKVIDAMRLLFPAAFLVGFKLQSGVSDEALFAEARALLARSRADAVVCNLLEETEPHNHRAWLLDASGAPVGDQSWRGKEEIARRLVETLPQLAVHKEARHAR
ncbi:hypothetical protein HS125_11915 [bacterium]|nr:hypothetical protein [bacterium]